MASENPRITLTPATIGFFLAIVSVLTVGWNAVSYFKSLETKNVQQDMRLDRTDEDRAAMRDLTTKTGELKEAVVRLTNVIDQSGLTKRAYYLAPRAFPDLDTISAQNTRGAQ